MALRLVTRRYQAVTSLDNHMCYVGDYPEGRGIYPLQHHEAGTYVSAADAQKAFYTMRDSIEDYNLEGDANHCLGGSPAIVVVHQVGSR